MLGNRFLRILTSTTVLATIVIAAGVTSASEEHLAALESELRAAEIAFAQTMADRDHAAFVSFLDEEAVFFSGEQPLRGADEIALAWSRYYDGEEASFSWAPVAVSVLESGNLGLSSGPVLNSEGKQIATFNSLWRRDGDGAWKVIFDRGCPPCNCP